MIVIKLENNIGCDHLCKTIQKVVNKHIGKHKDPNNLYLVIKIQEAVDADSQPKLGFSPS